MSNQVSNLREKAKTLGQNLWKHKAYIIGFFIGVVATHQFYQYQIVNHIFEIKQEIRNNNGINSQAEAILKDAADLINKQSGQWEGVREDLNNMNDEYEKSKTPSQDNSYSRPSDEELIRQLNDRIKRLDSK